jgi:hypothetical protein
MLYTTPFFQKKTKLVASGLLLTLCLATFCKNEPMDDDSTTVTLLPLDSIFGAHPGECYHYRKQLDTGVETFDTTQASILEIVRVDSIWIRATGCGAPSYYPWNLPSGSTDTVFTYSAYVGSNHYTMEINLIDRTIATFHSFSAVPFAPYFEEWTGKWKL